MALTLEWKAQNKTWRIHGLLWHELDMLEAYCQAARSKQTPVSLQQGLVKQSRPIPKQDNDILGGVAASYVGVYDDTPQARELVATAIMALLARLEQEKRAKIHATFVTPEPAQEPAQAPTPRPRLPPKAKKKKKAKRISTVIKLLWHPNTCAWSVYNLRPPELDLLEAYCQARREEMPILIKRPPPWQDTGVLLGVAAPYVGVTGPLCYTHHVRKLVLQAITNLLKTRGDAKRTG
jgi:hypothetical protein